MIVLLQDTIGRTNHSLLDEPKPDHSVEIKLSCCEETIRVIAEELDVWKKQRQLKKSCQKTRQLDAIIDNAKT